MNSNSARPEPPLVHGVVLAGDRGPDDPIAARFGVEGKALAPVAGRALLTHVLDALAEVPAIHSVVLVCAGTPAFRQAAAASRMPPRQLVFVSPGDSPSASAAAALAQLPAGDEVLLVTADHPLLQAPWLTGLLAGARTGNAELATALVPLDRVQQRYPRNRRTRLAFADGAMCSTNLFVFRSPRSRQVAELWREVERRRKRPWQLVAWLGAGTLLRYLTGRMTLAHAFAVFSRRAGVAVQPVLLADAEAAIDVDSLDDLVLVERVMAAARPMHATD
jgi:CTP:molybdopterin cytidylyltransferase MocA